MLELGQLLKSAREEKGLTIEDLQEITKIQKRYLEAIENGNFKLLPGPFYTRAFVKNIAETLGLNAEQILNQYEHALPSIKTDLVDMIPKRKRNVSSAFSIGHWISRVLLFLFIVLIVFIIYWFAVKVSPPTENQIGPNQIPLIEQEEGGEVGGTPATDENQESEQEEPVEPEPPKPELTFVKEGNKRAYYEIRNVENFVIKMKASRGRCWFDIRRGSDGKSIDTFILEKDEEKTWTITEESNIRIYLGATKYMDLYVNDLPIDLTEKPEAYTVDLTLVKDSTQESTQENES